MRARRREGRLVQGSGRQHASAFTSSSASRTTLRSPDIGLSEPSAITHGGRSVADARPSGSWVREQVRPRSTLSPSPCRSAVLHAPVPAPGTRDTHQDGPDCFPAGAGPGAFRRALLTVHLSLAAVRMMSVSSDGNAVAPEQLTVEYNGLDRRSGWPREVRRLTFAVACVPLPVLGTGPGAETGSVTTC